MRIVIIGLPGSGKTTLAKEVAKRLGAVHLNADDIRNNVHKDLGFSEADRLHQAKSMGFLMNKVHEAGVNVVCDFVCPTPETREQITGCFDVMVYMDTIDKGRFENTNRIFTPPANPDITFTEWNVANEDVVIKAVHDLKASPDYII